MRLPLLYLLEQLGLPAPSDSEGQDASFLCLEGIRMADDSARKPGILYLEKDTASVKYSLTDGNGLTASGTIPEANMQKALNACLDVWDAFLKLSKKTELLRAEDAPLQEYIPLFSELMGNPVYIVDSSSYNQVVFVENPRFSTWYISVRRASAMDISEHQVLK